MYTWKICVCIYVFVCENNFRSLCLLGYVWPPYSKPNNNRVLENSIYLIVFNNCLIKWKEKKKKKWTNERYELYS